MPGGIVARYFDAVVADPINIKAANIAFHRPCSSILRPASVGAPRWIGARRQAMARGLTPIRKLPFYPAKL